LFVEPSDPIAKQAARRMLEAEDLMVRSAPGEAWTAWQQAAVDSWVLVNPELAAFRAADSESTPTVERMRELAIRVERAFAGVPRDWRVQPHSDERTIYLARLGWWHEMLDKLYDPVWKEIYKLREGDASGLETLVRFLAADVRCFRSGYVKAEIIRLVTRLAMDDATSDRLRAIVILVVEGEHRREFRDYIRLARHVDSPTLRESLTSLKDAPSKRTARHARWMLDGLEARGPRPGAASAASSR
jgi:hypothetical protein